MRRCVLTAEFCDDMSAGFLPILARCRSGKRWPLSLRWSRLPGRNMEDLPAVEPVKIYENTYRLEPADNEK